MSYAQMLRNMVDKSGLTLREIADRCRDRGIPLDPSYISKVQSGKQAPPSEEISRALAEACGGDADDLVFEGYMNRAPQVIKDFLASISEMMKTIYDHFAKESVPEDALELARKQISEMTPYRILTSLPPLLKLTSGGPDGALYSPGPGPTMLRYPDTEAPEIVLPMPDDSMEPLIPKGASLSLQVEPEYQDGDIVILKRATEDYAVRRILHSGDNLGLLPINPGYAPVSCAGTDVRIAGRVKSVAYEIARR